MFTREKVQLTNTVVEDTSSATALAFFIAATAITTACLVVCKGTASNESKYSIRRAVASHVIFSASLLTLFLLNYASKISGILGESYQTL